MVPGVRILVQTGVRWTACILHGAEDSILYPTQETCEDEMKEVYIIVFFAIAVPVLLITIDRLVDWCMDFNRKDGMPLAWYIDLKDVEL